MPSLRLSHNYGMCLLNFLASCQRMINRLYLVCLHSPNLYQSCNDQLQQFVTCGNEFDKSLQNQSRGIPAMVISNAVYYKSRTLYQVYQVAIIMTLGLSRFLIACLLQTFIRAFNRQRPTNCISQHEIRPESNRSAAPPAAKYLTLGPPT